MGHSGDDQRGAIRMSGLTRPYLAPDRPVRTDAPAPLRTAAEPVSEPDYLRRIYGWAYLHPRAIRLFERQWIINSILWGNYAALRDAALAELSELADGRILQVACVYGNFSMRLAESLSGDGSLSVVDVAPIQLDNLRRKLGPSSGVTLYRQNSAALGFEDASFDAAVAFFLLHEQPLEVRIRTLHEAMRVLRPGGKLVIMDYHRPEAWHPLRYVMRAVFRTLEPFAMDLWHTEIRDWLPSLRRYELSKETFFNDLYQKVTIVVR